LVDETCVKVSGSWRYVYRAVDEDGQLVDVFVSKERDAKVAVKFFISVIGVHGAPTEVTTDRSAALASAISELLALALHDTTHNTSNRVDADHGRLKARLTDAWSETGQIDQRHHAKSCLGEHLRRGHFELGVAARPGLTLAAAFDELALVERTGDLSATDWFAPVDPTPQRSRS
jgi:IS6 family transposase